MTQLNPISSKPSFQPQQAASKGNVENTLAAATEEATESAATTRQEAASGDQVAARKIARQKQANQTRKPVSVKEHGKGDLVDHQG